MANPPADHGSVTACVGIQHPRLTEFGIRKENRAYCLTKWLVTLGQCHTQNCSLVVQPKNDVLSVRLHHNVTSARLDIFRSLENHLPS